MGCEGCIKNLCNRLKLNFGCEHKVSDKRLLKRNVVAKSIPKIDSPEFFHDSTTKVIHRRWNN